MTADLYRGSLSDGSPVAVVFGVTGLVGKELARRLVSFPGWKVYGVARRPDVIAAFSLSYAASNYHFIPCDLLDPVETERKLSAIKEDVTHVFWITWANDFPLDGPKCCEQNRAMMRNALDPILRKSTSLKHFSLQTGMKHYVSLQSPFDVTEQGMQVYDEMCPRVNTGRNFYYDMEDLLEEKLANVKAGWSVHRPGLLIGSSRRTLYNAMGCLGVYGSICKHLNLPFVFGGSRESWKESCIDSSDAGLVAEQHIWAATDEKLGLRKGEAYNAIDGTRFTWKEIWPALANKFGVELRGEAFVEDFWYSKEMDDKKEAWREIVERKNLVQTEVEDLANWGFLDILFRCPAKMLGTRSKANKLGFTEERRAEYSILYWVDQMRHERLIP
ncbi:hypothetical protein MLD38_017395 [Melastoma candidum]|uniref:Uncharacterized protein n=1 Tax=Melastoma candidum TaxID=119954 RepID=A0ACB9QRM1_9MYRT|nr:hypothetical protein MLD38_017395 [Melastoma candidum]